MVEVAYYHYEVELIMNSKSDLDDNGDGIVDHNEFRKLPPGFEQYKKEKDAQISGTAAISKGQLDMSSILSEAEAVKDEGLEELMEEDDLVHEKVLDLEEKLSGVGSDISSIRHNMENLMAKLGIK